MLRATNRSLIADMRGLSPTADRSLYNLTASYLALALLLGGAGMYYPLVTMLIEALAVVLLAYAGLKGMERIVSPSLSANLLLISILLLPLIQLIPLPYATWAGLPGRGLPADILDIATLAGGPRPASLNPHSTLSSFLSLLPAAAIFLVASRLPAPQQLRLVTIVIAVAVLSAVLGALQKASGGSGLTVLFPSAHSASGPGLFVNRNHQATFLLVTMPLAAAAAHAAALRSAQAPVRLIALGGILLLGAGVVATTSRMGILLLPLAILGSVLILFPPKLTFARTVVPIVGLSAAVFVALQSSGVEATLRRFTDHDVRFDYWADTKLSIELFWPVGSGFGTFRDVFPSFENLNVVGTARVRNAHNDYLELLLEGGLPALLLLIGFSVVLVYHAVRRLRSPPSASSMLKSAALVGIALIMLHSIVDYPLRMFSLLVVFALLCAILVTPPVRIRRS